MSDPDRVNLWPSSGTPTRRTSAGARSCARWRSRRRGRLRRRVRRAAARAAPGSGGSTTPPTFSNKPEAKILNFYNWTDYIADRHDPELPKGDRDQGHLRQLQLERRALREDVGRQHGLRHHRPDRRDAREDEAREPGRAARPLADPERRRTSTRASATRPTTPATSTRSRGSGARPGIGFDKTKVGGAVTDWDAFQLPGGQGQVVVPRRGPRRVRDGAVRAEEGPEHHQRLRPRRRQELPHRPEEEGQADHLRLPGPAQGRRADACARRTPATCSRSRPTTRTSSTSSRRRARSRGSTPWRSRRARRTRRTPRRS